MCSQGTREYISVMATMMFTLKECFVRNNRETSLIGEMFVSYDRQNIQLRHSCTHERGETIILIKVKSCNALLRMLLLRIRTYTHTHTHTRTHTRVKKSII